MLGTISIYREVSDPARGQMLGAVRIRHPAAQGICPTLRRESDTSYTNG